VGETDIIEFSLANITVNKNVGFFTIPVIRTGNYSYDASVQYYTQDGTASAGVDYGQLSGTLNFTDGVLTVNTPHVMIYDTEPTITRTFTLQLVNPVNGVLGDNTTLNVTVQATGTYVISVNPNPCALYTNVSATLNINDPNYLYDNIQWFFNGVQFSEYRLNDSSQWQNWNGAAWVNCTNASVFQQSHYVDVVSHQAFTAFINYHDTRMCVAVGNFNSTDNVTQTNYYIRVVDSTGADLSTFNGHFFESEYPVKEYWFNWSGYGAVLDLNRHFQGVISADGYINGTIAFETTYNSSAAATYRTITITMVSSDVPADPLQAFLDVKVYDATTNEMVPDAVFTLTNSSGSKTYQIYGTVKRITIMKDTAYTWKASSSSYYALTGSINMTAGQAMLLVPLNPIPAPTATPQPSTGYYTGGDGQATYTPYTDTQRQNQAMTMIDQLLSAGPSLMQLGILAVFMGLVMMLFPDGKKRRYR
jgi:hypothetical protein